jgi:phosphotransacetylase
LQKISLPRRTLSIGDKGANPLPTAEAMRQIAVNSSNDAGSHQRGSQATPMACPEL